MKTFSYREWLADNQAYSNYNIIKILIWQNILR